MFIWAQEETTQERMCREEKFIYLADFSQHIRSLVEKVLDEVIYNSTKLSFRYMPCNPCPENKRMAVDDKFRSIMNKVWRHETSRSRYENIDLFESNNKFLSKAQISFLKERLSDKFYSADRLSALLCNIYDNERYLFIVGINKEEMIIKNQKNKSITYPKETVICLYELKGTYNKEQTSMFKDEKFELKAEMPLEEVYPELKEGLKEVNEPEEEEPEKVRVKLISPSSSDPFSVLFQIKLKDLECKEEGPEDVKQMEKVREVIMAIGEALERLWRNEKRLQKLFSFEFLMQKRKRIQVLFGKALFKFIKRVKCKPFFWEFCADSFDYRKTGEGVSYKRSRLHPIYFSKTKIESFKTKLFKNCLKLISMKDFYYIVCVSKTKCFIFVIGVNKNLEVFPEDRDVLPVEPQKDLEIEEQGGLCLYSLDFLTSDEFKIETGISFKKLSKEIEEEQIAEMAQIEKVQMAKIKDLLSLQIKFFFEGLRKKQQNLTFAHCLEDKTLPKKLCDNFLETCHIYFSSSLDRESEIFNEPLVFILSHTESLEEIEEFDSNKRFRYARDKERTYLKKWFIIFHRKKLRCVSWETKRKEKERECFSVFVEINKIKITTIQNKTFKAGEALCLCFKKDIYKQIKQKLKLIETTWNCLAGIALEEISLELKKYFKDKYQEKDKDEDKAENKNQSEVHENKDENKDEYREKIIEKPSTNYNEKPDAPNVSQEEAAEKAQKENPKSFSIGIKLTAIVFVMGFIVIVIFYFIKD